MEARELLKKYRTETLQELTSGIYHAGRESRQWVETGEYGVPFFGSTDILSVDLSYLPFISKKQVKANQNFTIRKNWTLITRSGTIGRTAYARADFDGLACSEHVMRVVPDESKVLPGYIYAYLISRFGVPLVTSGTYGSIIQSIEPHHLSDLPVPRLDAVEGRAHELIQRASELLTQYQASIDEATRLYFESAGLDDITAAEWHDWGSDVGFVVASPSMNSLRALNFNPRFARLCERIRRGAWKPLGELCPGSLKRGGRYRRIEADPEFSYQMIGQKQVFWLRPEGRWIAKTCVDDDVIVRPGTTLIAGAGTLAESEVFCRCEFVWGNACERAYSELFNRVLPDERIMLNGALFAFMRSETAFRMLRSISFGSKLQYPHPRLLPSLPIPYPDSNTRQKSHELIVSGYEMKEEAVRLEDKARALVEDAIEKGGN